MHPLTPKQTEIRERESRILALARPMLAAGGIAALSMEAIAKEMRYAKGTIYNHFSCKEEILLALAIQSTETRLALFRAGVSSQHRSRDRMAAIGIACEDFRLRFADLLAIDHLVRHATVWEKASEQRRETLLSSESRCMELVASIGHQAVRDGDLALPPDHHVEDLVFGLWSLSYGGMLIDLTSPGLSEIGIRDALAAIRRNCNALMDGFGWKPLYDADSFGERANQIRTVMKREITEAVTRSSQPTGKDLMTHA